MDKGALPTLTDGITELVGNPDEPMPDGRCTEERLRTLLKDEEMEAIWPTPSGKEEAREGSKRRASKK